MLSYCTRLALLALLVPLAHAQPIDDVKVQYAQMHITRAQLSDTDLEVDFTRHLVDVSIGRGPATLGITYQEAVKGRRDPLPAALAHSERGLMLTAGYDHLLTSRWRIEAYARIGVLGRTQPAQALYATDTDLRLNVVTYHPDGWGLLAGHPVFPSAYAGGIVNKYGRVQGIGGGGVWWNGVGTYLTAFRAFNGVEDPVGALGRGDEQTRHLFAELKNAGVSASVSYEYGPVEAGVRRNWALRNGGEDVSVWLTLRHTFRQEVLR